MGRAPCCAKVGLRRGPWTQREDRLLKNYIQVHGEGDWKYLPKKAGLLRCGKSCRLRWRNYLRPDIKRGNISSDEEDLIIKLHSLLGNRWSLIAGRLPGRTDNEIKNYWNSRLRKKVNQHSISKLPNVDDAEPEPQIVKAHHPKPGRASPFSLQRNDRYSRGAKGGGSSATQVQGTNCSSEPNDGYGGVGCRDRGTVNGLDFAANEGRSSGSRLCDDGFVGVGCCDGLRDGYDRDVVGYVAGGCDGDFVGCSDQYVYEPTFVPTIDLEMIYGELSQLLNV